MHFLYLYTDYFKNEDIPLTLKKLGHSYDTISQSFMTYDSDELLTEQLITMLNKNHYDAVLNFGYIPYLSDICTNFQIPYVSWTYDSILHSLYHESIENPYNILFIYDLAEYDYLKTHFHIPYLFYLPLAVNLDRVNALSFTNRDAQVYDCEISFVGGLYQQNTYVDLEPLLSQEERQYFEQAFTYFHGQWGKDSIYEWFSNEDADFLQKRLPDYLKNDGLLPNRRYFADILLSKPIGSRERIHMLKLLGSRHQVRLYTKPQTDTSALSQVECHPYLNYYDAMYKAFRYSRINLNITLHGMMSGVPLRCFDIMGARGFLLTNYQADMEELFDMNYDLICYHNFDEMCDKVDYYLHHESERKKISLSGYLTIETRHTYEHRLQYICDTLQKCTSY